jgi:hypothetical protein
MSSLSINSENVNVETAALLVDAAIKAGESMGLEITKLANYSKRVETSFIHHEVDFLVSYDHQKTLEGPETKGTVIVTFSGRSLGIYRTFE